METNLTVTHIFTSGALQLLRKRLDEAEALDDFFHEVDQIVADESNLLKSPVPIQFSDSLGLGPKQDARNALVIYEGMASLDRANAADPRIWTYLSLVTHREYLQNRWSSSLAKSFRSAILDHGLMTGSSARKLVRNSVSRLWWVAFLTYDPDLERPRAKRLGDPFAYTDWAFEIQDRISAIYERRVGRSPKLMWAVVEVLEEYDPTPDKIAIQGLLKTVYQNTGFKRLELLSEQALRDFVRQNLDALYQRRPDDRSNPGAPISDFEDVAREQNH